MKLPANIYGIQLRTIAYAVVAGLLFLGWGVAGCQHQRAEREAAKRLAVEVQRDQVIDANKTLQTTIDIQTKALEKWAELGVTAQDLAEIQKALDENERQLNAAWAAFKKLKEKERANPDCAALLSADLGRACPGIAGRLRQYESRHPD